MPIRSTRRAYASTLTFCPRPKTNNASFESPKPVAPTLLQTSQQFGKTALSKPKSIQP
jgi:hypothetical protein